MKHKFTYAPIHCRTHYSFLRGLVSPREAVEQAVSMGASAVGIADVNGFYGLISFASAARERGLKALYGTALYDREEYLLSLLCLNRRGFSRANEILGRYIEALGDPESRYDPVEDLRRGGWAGLWLVSNRPDVLSRLKQRSRDGLFVGLAYGFPYAGLRRWAIESGLEMLAYNDAVYLRTSDLHLYRVLRAIGRRTIFDAIPPNGGLSEAHAYIGAEEMFRFFSGVPEALANSRRYIEMSEGFQFPQSFIFPRFKGFSEEEAFIRLRELCLSGVKRRYGITLSPQSSRSSRSRRPAAIGSGSRAGKSSEESSESPQTTIQRRKILERLEYELQIIRRKGFSSYFLVVHDIVRRVPRTCGRGSAAAGIVTFLLGITHVDPLKHNLFFERFLNMGRKDPPDIDVDFPWDERDKTLQYVFDTYPGSAAMVADHVTFARRSAIREPARVLGYEQDEIGRLSRLWRSGQSEKLPDDLREVVPRLYGMPRHLGTHPGGVVITPGPITDYTHVQTSPLGWPVMAWEKDAAEDAGLVKIDLLGNRSLGVLRDSLELINGKYGTSIEWESFSPLKNRATREMIASGDTLGVFYVESPATRQLLKKMGRGDYEHLVIASSIIRPAANRFINEFVRRLKGGAYKRFPEPLGGLLDESYGIMVYQEDVSRIAIAAAGFDAAEADRLRKILSKKDRERRLPAFRERFFAGGRSRGFRERLLKELWEAVLSFEGYSFCKAHSASYALLSYRLAWVKRFFPLEFYTSVINNAGGFYSRQVYLNQIRRMGYAVLGPDVNASSAEYILEDEGRAVRIGLGQLKELDSQLVYGIPEERKYRGAFTDVYDFFRRVPTSIASFRTLVRSGALDSISDGHTRPQLLWIYYHREKDRSLLLPPPVPSSIGDYPPRLKLLDEYRTTGLILSRHPLEIFRSRINPFLGGDIPLIDSRLLPRSVGRKVRIAGIMITEKEVRTKFKQEMSFVAFEDSFGLFETVFFPDTYRRLFRHLEDGFAFILEGVVEQEWSTQQLHVQNMLSLTRSRQNGQPAAPRHQTLDIQAGGRH